MKALGQIRVTIGNEQATFVLRKELLVGRDEAMPQVRRMKQAWLASLQGDSSATPAESFHKPNVTTDDERMASPLSRIFEESVFQAAEDQPAFDEWMESMD
jgi:hypothetical protein